MTTSFSDYKMNSSSQFSDVSSERNDSMTLNNGCDKKNNDFQKDEYFESFVDEHSHCSINNTDDDENFEEADDMLYSTLGKPDTIDEPQLTERTIVSYDPIEDSTSIDRTHFETENLREDNFVQHTPENYRPLLDPNSPFSPVYEILQTADENISLLASFSPQRMKKMKLENETHTNGNSNCRLDATERESMGQSGSVNCNETGKESSFQEDDSTWLMVTEKRKEEKDFEAKEPEAMDSSRPSGSNSESNDEFEAEERIIKEEEEKFLKEVEERKRKRKLERSAEKQRKTLSSPKRTSPSPKRRASPMSARRMKEPKERNAAFCRECERSREDFEEHDEEGKNAFGINEKEDCGRECENTDRSLNVSSYLRSETEDNKNERREFDEEDENRIKCVHCEIEKEKEENEKQEQEQDDDADDYEREEEASLSEASDSEEEITLQTDPLSVTLPEAVALVVDESELTIHSLKILERRINVERKRKERREEEEERQLMKEEEEECRKRREMTMEYALDRIEIVNRMMKELLTKKEKKEDGGEGEGKGVDEDEDEDEDEEREREREERENSCLNEKSCLSQQDNFYEEDEKDEEEEEGEEGKTVDGESEMIREERENDIEAIEDQNEDDDYFVKQSEIEGIKKEKEDKKERRNRFSQRTTKSANLQSSDVYQNTVIDQMEREILKGKKRSQLQTDNESSFESSASSFSASASVSSSNVPSSAYSAVDTPARTVTGARSKSRSRTASSSSSK
ncbi:uncharacterized protein MONOS_2502 [Monocercomonoides exilis]|uniref:uncharacterized protein n=1 Tax=Monocercomonoides exilis TaxID=2049356 RepID=UPI00355AAF84|nr:hypothetical protein MONOS_2502 [Monocercomonoides exilis]|eukprot:MONOS_2502.1-p1 / transcript=MONOS_2502.1 / gene=MONOS_2502 / organism=Monocercomonoides_exilis_PA203 / gene_product=unspecified product / transcript_product=unspecified product / location=Mono_scaffold00052:47382-49680(+) / protein_length=745 / sequence_SO=supercontig / SO=protein_coding / is_pseudo=false